MSHSDQSEEDRNRVKLTERSLPKLRTTSTITPWQKAFLDLKSDVNGSAIFREAIAKRASKRQDIDIQTIKNVFKTLYYKHGIEPEEAIKESSSLDDLLQKPQNETQ